VSEGIVTCDACPVLCRIRPGRTGACDRYANVAGRLARTDPLVLLADGTLTAVGAGTTYPDYKPAPLIVGSQVDGIDMVTVVSEGVFSYCGLKVKIDTDRHLGAERATVRAEGEPVGHVTTAEYGSRMLSLGGVHHLTGGSKRAGVVTCATLLALANKQAVDLTIDGGAAVRVQAGAAPVVDGVVEERMRVGCGSATIGIFGPQWQRHADEVIVVDDHITGVLTEHQAGRFLGMRAAGIRVRGRRSTPGRYFQVAQPGVGWGGTDIADPLEIIERIDPATAWPGLRLLMVSTTGEHSAWFVLDEGLRPVPQAAPPAIRDAVARIGENCEPALCSVLFMAGAGGSLRAGATDNPVLLTRSVQAGRTRVDHPHGRRAGAAGPCVRLCADAGAGGAHRVHDDAGGVCGDGGVCRGGPQPGGGAGRAGAHGCRRPAVNVAGRVPASGPPHRPAVMAAGSSLQLHAGPIDLVIRAWGASRAVEAAFEAARAAFSPILPSLCSELAQLRRPLPSAAPRGAVGRAMHAACMPYAAGFITPMAAVAGAVADHVLAAMVAGAERAGTEEGGAPLERALVNNRGDIAFHLAPGQVLRCGLVADVAAPAIDGAFVLHSGLPSRGIATSGRACKGRGGRSFSFGIADAVTVLAHSAAAADAAASIIGNAVDLPGHAGIERRPASSIDPDSDLGDRPITWDVGVLAPADVARALEGGRLVAERMRRAGLIDGAVLCLRGQVVACLEPRAAAA
jgi:ApbE superfamily uncharacterized protein (UPF0280 family)